MRFGGIDWFNYRGSDDTGTIAIPHDKVKLFPRNANGVFRRANAPAENFTYANTVAGTNGGGWRLRPIRCSSAPAPRCC
jgi:hypothetical protein